MPEEAGADDHGRQGYAKLEPVGLAEEEESREKRLALAKTTIGITMREGGSCKVESSVYGAAIVMPQMARTVGWNKTLGSMAFRALTMLVINCALQTYLLKMLSQEENVMDRFAGQMSLCDFGAFVEKCPGPGCKGPGGTDITADRMYNWAAYDGRNFVKSSLKAVFPDRAQDIDDKVDVGEYAVESYWCRWACVVVFMIPCMKELQVILKMVHLLYVIPTKAEPWIVAKEREDDAPLRGTLDEVTLKVAGMPLKWKIVNLAIVAVPKAILWKQLVETGVTFLMETSGIENVIVNAVGLTFIMNIDELIYDSLLVEETRNFVDQCEDFPLYDQHASCVGDMSVLSDDQILEKHAIAQRCRSWRFFRDTIALLPGKLLVTIMLTWVFVYEYYIKYCERSSDGRWVSKTMYLPKTVVTSWAYAFFPAIFPLEVEDEPYWQMPGQ